MFLILVLSLTALFVWQRNNHEATKMSLATPAPSPIVSEHDWAKHSLDRAREVRNQVTQARQQNEQP